MNDRHQLKQAGLKVTGPRLKILQILEENSEKHMNVEEIHRLLNAKGEDVGLATVYRVLTQFEAADLVIRHHFENDVAVFELNEGVHHDHLVCINCGAVSEFHDELIEAQQRKIAKAHGFRMTDHALNIYGICQKCDTKM